VLCCAVLCYAAFLSYHPLPSQHRARALAACERYLQRKPRGEILAAPSLLVEVDGCCSSSFKPMRVVLRDGALEYYQGQRRAGLFPLRARSRVLPLEARAAERRAGLPPLRLRVEHGPAAGGGGGGADYLTLAAPTEALRELW
jgi:hypothetical protein